METSPLDILATDDNAYKLARKLYVQWSSSGGEGLDPKIAPIVRSLNALEGITTTVSCESHPNDGKLKFYVAMAANVVGIQHLLTLHDRLQTRLQTYEADPQTSPTPSERVLPYPYLLKLSFSSHELIDPDTNQTVMYKSIMLKVRILTAKHKRHWIHLLTQELAMYHAESLKRQNAAYKAKVA